MAKINFSASGACQVSGGIITGSWSSATVQNATVNLIGLNTAFTDAKTFTSADNGTFTFSALPNDFYEVSVTGSIDGGSDVAEIPIACDTTGGSGTCEVIINSVTITPGDAESATTATINATGAGTLEYSLNGGAFQSSPVFTVTPGAHIATVRNTGNPDCNAVTSFLVTEPEALSVTMPATDWKPVSLPIYYTFTSPEPEPGILAIQIEVSTNGLNFNGSYILAEVVLPPNSNKQYVFNIAPYMESAFSPAAPVFSGVDINLFRLYRLKAGMLTTPDARCYYGATYTAPVAGIITLSYPGINNPQGFNGIETTINLATNELRNTLAPGTMLRCPAYPLHLYWLNRAGGWNDYVFDGKHEYGQEFGDAATWQDEDGLTHRAGIEAVEETVNVYSGFVPMGAYDAVFSILSAIRVYHRENGVFREVNLATGDFRRHKAGQRRKELNFSFTYAQPLTVQRA